MRSFGVQVSNVQFLDWAELCHVVAGAARLLSESVQWRVETPACTVHPVHPVHCVQSTTVDSSVAETPSYQTHTHDSVSILFNTKHFIIFNHKQSSSNSVSTRQQSRIDDSR